MSARKDLTDKTYGDFIVVKLDNIRDNERAIWLVKCNTCKSTKKARGTGLLNGEASTCNICRYNKNIGLTMKQIKEIMFLYFDDSITKQEIADRYKITRDNVYSLKYRFEWGDAKKKLIKRPKQERPIIYWDEV